MRCQLLSEEAAQGHKVDRFSHIACGTGILLNVYFSCFHLANFSLVFDNFLRRLLSLFI